MKLKLFATVSITAALAISSLAVPVYANALNNNNNTISISPVNESLTQKSIKILGSRENLYVEFSQPEEALQKYKSEHSEFINDISEYCNINSLTDDNWEEFRDAFYQYVDETGILESSPEFYDTVTFFDIYENTSKNENIVSYVERNNLSESLTISTRSLFSNDLFYEDLFTMLPYTSTIVENKNEQTLQQCTSNNNTEIQPFAIVKSFDTTKGIAYATKYATKRNTPTYYSFSRGDCANFTSQILENGGVKQVVYDSEAKGWWHTTKSILGIKTHKHSQSWSMADTFARYMGVSNKTKTHKTFAANVRAGDFITLDQTSDGDWDHMGFVTTKDNYIGSYGYYDYKVAQHTTDYHAWASSSTNNWDTYNNKGTYAIVRR